MLLYDTVERCNVCGSDLDVWYFQKGKIILWCSCCKAMVVFQDEQASLFAPTQAQLELGGEANVSPA